MKRYTFKSFLMAAATITLMGVGFSSCDPADSHDELTGKYAAPTQLNITSASVLDKTKDGNLRTFTIQFGTSEGVTLNMLFEMVHPKKMNVFPGIFNLIQKQKKDMIKNMMD